MQRKVSCLFRKQHDTGTGLFYRSHSTGQCCIVVKYHLGEVKLEPGAGQQSTCKVVCGDALWKPQGHLLCLPVASLLAFLSLRLLSCSRQTLPPVGVGISLW